MLSISLFYLLAVFCTARTHSLPLYPDTNLESQTADLIQKLVAEVEDSNEDDTVQGEQREANNLYPLLMQHSGGKGSWNKGTKDVVQQGSYTNMLDDLKDVVWKLAASEKLRSQGFLRSEQSLPKTSKRACFWKYCVTN